MAKIDDIAKSLNIEINLPTSTSGIGKKRRAWISDEDNHNDKKEIINQESDIFKGVYRPENEKGSINQVYESGSSTRLINQIDKPKNLKGSINQIDKPIINSLDGLRGNPLIIVQFLFEAIKQNDGKSTGKIVLLEIIKSLNISRDSSRTGLRFLLKNGLVNRIGFHPGKRGWSEYEIVDWLFNELEISYVKGSIHPLSLKGSNSSSLLNTTTTKNIDPIKNDVMADDCGDWKFDLTPYAKFGFTGMQIKQLIPLGVISPEDVEQSLIEFNFDYENNLLPAIRLSKVGFLMGLFRKGVKYTSEAYLNEQEAAIAEMAKRTQEKNKKLLESRFIEWLENVDPALEKKIENELPNYLTILYRAHGIKHPDLKEWLFAYFARNK